MHRYPNARKNNGERGQATILVVLVTGTFLLGAVGLATDFSNLWFHQQKAQTAADAACQAAAMDLLTISQGTTTSTAAGFTPGTGFNCSGKTGSTPNSGATPCKYASFNGYSAPGLTAGTESNEVAVSFPASIPGVTAPPSALTANPFLRVDVTDRVKVYVAALFTSRTQDVVATAKCGLVLAQSPIPIIVLDPTDVTTLSTQGNPAITITGGPVQSIQVNSNNSTAINIGGSSTINLTQAGPSGTGGILGVQGGPSTAPGGFTSGTPTSNYWKSPNPPISDPFAQLAAPSKPAAAPAPTGVAYHVNGCPDTTGCTEYQPGDYPANLDVKGATGIFDPGIYYLEAGLRLDSNSTVRPSTVTGNGNGTMFYFSGPASNCPKISGSYSCLAVDSNSGKNASLDAFATSSIQCPGGSAVTVKDSSGNPVTSLGGNILLGICSGTYGDPLGQNRGLLFFQDRSTTGTTPSWGGGGQFLLAGNMYFHSCNSSGTGTGCGTVASGYYSDQFSLSGNSGSGTYVLGDIVTDQLLLGGTSGISMQLNPASAYNILKVQLLQ